MKKTKILLNVFIILIALISLCCFIMLCIRCGTLWKYYKQALESQGDVPLADGVLDEHLHLSVYCTILCVSLFIIFILSVTALFFFNYRFDGVSLREKVAARLLESKEKRAQYRVEKAAADKQAAIEDKQKRLEELQAELDELKKE